MLPVLSTTMLKNKKTKTNKTKTNTHPIRIIGVASITVTIHLLFLRLRGGNVLHQTLK